MAADCACGDPYKADHLVPVTFSIFTDDKGMVVFRAAAANGLLVADLRLCPHEALEAARDLEANARLAALEREQGS
jgi:hypothetical protein